MLKTLFKKNSLILIIVTGLFLIPVLVEAGGGCKTHKISSYEPYYYSSNPYSRSNAYSYPGYASYYPTTSRYNSVLPYSYSPSIYSYGQPSSLYSFGNLGFNYGGYPGGQITSKEYTTEKSLTYYLPGGQYTDSFSESTQVSYLPTYNPYNLFSYGGWGGFGGWY